MVTECLNKIRKVLSQSHDYNTPGQLNVNLKLCKFSRIHIIIDMLSTIQLTNETYGDPVAMLSHIIQLTEINTAEQTFSAVLSKIASYFNDLAGFMNESNVIINMTVSTMVKL